MYAPDCSLSAFIDHREGSSLTHQHKETAWINGKHTFETRSMNLQRTSSGYSTS